MSATASYSNAILLALICSLACPARGLRAEPTAGGSGPPPKTSNAAEFKSALAAEKERLLAEFASNDDARIAGALEDVESFARQSYGSRQSAILEILLLAKRYDDLDRLAIALMDAEPANVYALGGLQRLRARSFLSSGKIPESLSAAKSYYCVARIPDTSDAISIVSLCLKAAHPKDSEIVDRFQKQQIAWSNSRPSADDKLGEPVLESIDVVEPHFAATAAQVNVSDFSTCLAKGNMLLLAGRCDDARTVFESARTIAPPKRVNDAIESVARSLRAQSGSLAAANAYLRQLQQSGAAPDGDTQKKD